MDFQSKIKKIYGSYMYSMLHVIYSEYLSHSDLR